MHTSAVSSIISFLTDSLVPFYHPAFLHAVRLHLRTSLPGYFASSPELCLSLTISPPSVISQIPLEFYQWMSLLGHQSITILTSPTEVKAVFASQTATIWREDGEEDLQESNIPFIARGITSSVKMAVHRSTIRVPSPPLLPQVTTPIDVDYDSSSSSSSDLDSDDGNISEDSMTSVSSARSQYSVSKSETPYLPRAPSAQTYIYQGGETNVVTGGVMLGIPSGEPAPLAHKRTSNSDSKPPLHNTPYTPRSPPKRTASRTSRRVLLGPECSNWRQRD